MKKILLLAATVALLASCATPASDPTDAPASTPDTRAVTDVFNSSL